MENVLRDMSGKDISDRYKQLIHDVEKVAFRTDIVATSGTKKSDSSPVCNDAYTTLSQEFSDALSEISKAYKDGNTSIPTRLHQLIKSFEHEITDKCKFSMSTSGRVFVTQSFRDESSDRIYSYAGFVAICKLVLSCVSVLIDKQSTTAQIDDLAAKCITYSQDKMFDFTAGKTMGALGYTSIEDVQLTYNHYKDVLVALSSPEVSNTISSIQAGIAKLITDKSSLDNTLSNELSTGSDVSEHMDTYKKMLESSMYCKLINRLVVGSLSLADRLDATIKNVVDVACRYNITTPTMNITEDMGCVLSPIVTEYRAVALESMTNQLKLLV